MIFEQVTTGGCLSYLLGCENSRGAALIDPELTQVERYLGLAARDGLRVIDFEGRSYRLEHAAALSVDEAVSSRRSAAAEGRLVAPMPGHIVKVLVQAGQQVAANQPLVVLEAMKMEHVVEAPRAGSVTEVCVEVGQQVASGVDIVNDGEFSKLGWSAYFAGRLSGVEQRPGQRSVTGPITARDARDFPEWFEVAQSMGGPSYSWVARAAAQRDGAPDPEDTPPVPTTPRQPARLPAPPHQYPSPPTLPPPHTCADPPTSPARPSSCTRRSPPPASPTTSAAPSSR